MLSKSSLFSSSQALLMVSHISAVRAVRTCRALRRAMRRQLRIEVGLRFEKARNRVTLAGDTRS